MFHVTALGNALVDTEFQISDDILTKTKLLRGNMTLADNDAQNHLFKILNEHQILPAKQSGGGSAANSMVAFCALGGQAFYHCRVGGDQQAKFYLDDLQAIGVSTNATKAMTTGATGSCAVLVTPDGERTMQTNLGASSHLNHDNIDFEKISQSQYLYLEGYLAMSDALLPTIENLCQQARQNGTKIVVSFADPAVVRFAKNALEVWLKNTVDVIFCNLEEATLFSNTDNANDAAQALLAHSKLVVITNGAHAITIGKQTKSGCDITQIDVPSAKTVLDTNGAGDNFAGAFLYGLSQNLDEATCVKLAGTVASQVVAQFGARLEMAQYTQAKKSVLYL